MKSQHKHSTAVRSRFGNSSIGNRPEANGLPRASRSAITNGISLLPDVDGRGAWARRFRDLIQLHLSDRGGESNASEAEKALIRRCAALIVEMERLEQRWALNDGATPRALDRYQRCVNTLRRTLESLGLDRTARTVNGQQIDGTARLVEAIRGGGL